MKTPFDQVPEYEFGSDGSLEPFRMVKRDDFQEFLIHHHGHRLENLKIIEDSFVSEKAYSEPVKISFFKATNGKERFVVKKSRERIDEPLTYRLVPGDYNLKCMTVKLQSEEIVKQLEREVNPPFSQDKIDSFLKLYRDVTEDIDVADLERIPQESDRPLEIFYKMNDVHLMYLLRNCHRIFKAREYSSIEEFIQREKDDGVLLLKATYQIQFTEIAKANITGISVSFPIKKERIVEKK